MKMSSTLQFMQMSGNGGSGKSPIAQSVGMQSHVSRVHEQRIARHEMYMNMMKYRNKKRGI